MPAALPSLLAWLAVLLLGRARPADACSCSPIHPQQAFCNADVVIRAKAVSAKEVDSGNDIYGNPIKRIQYEIKQIKMFKGPDKDIEFIYTAPSTAVCGRLLDTGGKKEYLIAGGWLQGRALGGCRWQCWPCCLACLPRCLRHVCRLPGHGFPPRPPSPTTSPRGTPWLRPGCAR
uniref:Metalloproteinase inhibitor 2 n=1 Tax=Accipiter nisus TaxID=211598 RepID=A0A8B9RPT6_9AVES